MSSCASDPRFPFTGRAHATVYGMQVALMEAVNAYFKGPKLGKVLVTGKVILSYDRGLAEYVVLLKVWVLLWAPKCTPRGC